MKVIEGIIDIVTTIIIVLIFVWAIVKGGLTHTYAMAYNDMSTAERASMYIFDRDRYHQLEDSYNFIVNIPIIGETL